MPVETPVRRRRRVRHRPRLIPCLLALVAVLLVIKWIDPFAPGERPLPETPDWITVELLPLNEFSRPGTPLEEVNGIVIHYVGNPGTTAAQNHSFFTNLAQTGETYASSHFLVGLDGEVLQNVPLNEVAYCSNQRNDDTISIECCHPDDSGEFTSATYESLVRLTRWLMEEYGLTQEQVADRMGKSRPAIANTLRLPALPEDLLTLVEEGTLSAGHARAILGAPTAELQREAAKQVVSRGLSVRQTEQLVKLLQKQPEETRKGGSTDEIALYLGELEKSLSGQLGRKVTISHHGKKGRVQLEYYNNEDLEALLSLLNTLHGEGVEHL